VSPHRDHFLEAADRIGARMCRDAWWSGDACNWFGWASTILNGEWTPVYQALGPSESNQLAGLNLYSGTAGIGLFLARLCHITNDATHVRTLRGVINQLLQNREIIHSDPGFGFYAGRSGIAYALIEAGQVLEFEALVSYGLEELVTAGSIEPRADAIDVIEGSAGLIPVLLAQASRFDRGDLADHALRHGEYVLSLAQESDAGWSWDTVPMPVHQRLTGLSHGVSGIVFAMLELYRYTSDSQFLEAARQGIRYEAHQFDEIEQNWLDHQIHETVAADAAHAKRVRSERFSDISAPIGAFGAQINQPVVAQCRTAWCHGAPGIGFCRLAAHNLVPDDEQITNDLEIALAATVADVLQFDEQLPDAVYFGLPSLRDWCLCHGRAGNADLLVMATDSLGDPQFRSIAEAVGDWGIDQYQNSHSSWPSSAAGESPDLMTGLAGIGYFYLRLFDSAKTPSVLLMPGQIS
jgi:lantibiotic modifying enzyme